MFPPMRATLLVLFVTRCDFPPAYEYDDGGSCHPDKKEKSENMHGELEQGNHNAIVSHCCQEK
jgi:hypothetical protein